MEEWQSHFAIATPLVFESVFFLRLRINTILKSNLQNHRQIHAKFLVSKQKIAESIKH